MSGINNDYSNKYFNILIQLVDIKNKIGNLNNRKIENNIRILIEIIFRESLAMVFDKENSIFNDDSLNILTKIESILNSIKNDISNKQIKEEIDNILKELNSLVITYKLDKY